MRSILILPNDRSGNSSLRPYRALYLTQALLHQEGIMVSPRDAHRPILLLSGTSFTMEDRSELIQDIAAAGYEVASIETEQGGLFDVALDPPKDRLDALRHFLGYLEETAQVEELTILAMSYSAFETIRLLLEDPVRYRRRIRGILFVNPAGLCDTIGFLSHSTRFIRHHALKGYLQARRRLKELSGESMSQQAAEREFCQRELFGITVIVHRLFSNIARSYREVRDIVSFRIKDSLQALQNEFGYDFHFFLQSDDQLLPVEISLKTLTGVIPAENIRIVPGGHVDLLFQKWQRKALLDVIEEIRSRNTIACCGVVHQDKDP